MKKEYSLVRRLESISELIELTNFYSINLWTMSNQISLQGHSTEINRKFAKEQNIILEYDNETGILRGENSDKTLRISLT